MEKRKMNWPVILAFSAAGLCLVVCMSLGLLVHFAPDLYQYSLDQSSLQVGSSAPDFELASLDGEIVQLSQFRGQPVLLSIGATWCPDCRVEAPLLQALHERRPELVVLLVDSKESTQVVQEFADEFELTHPILLDRDGAVLQLYQVIAIPTELFIDADGIIRAKIIESITPELLARNLPLIGIVP